MEAVWLRGVLDGFYSAVCLIELKAAEAAAVLEVAS